MGYYDSVKDSVRENKNKKEKDSSGKGSFDTLKENAEKTSEEEEKGDDTPIEVLEEDGLSRESPQQSQQQDNKRGNTENGSSGSNPLTGSNTSSQEQVSQDISNLESKMDKLIEQNERMIEILESFGQ